MMRRGRTWICVVSSFALCAGASAAVADPPGQPYHGIVDRNVFGLKPPPPPPRPEDNQPPPPKVTLTGITTLLGKKLALMTMQLPAKPPAPAKEESYMLAEGEGQDELEVLQIDEKAGKVQVKNHGTPQTLDFVNNGAKLQMASLPAAAAPPPGFGKQIPVPGAVNPGMGGANIFGGGKQLPTRPVRATSYEGNQAYPGGANSAMGSPAMGGIGFSQYSAPTANPQAARPVLTPEEQTIMIEAQRQQYHDGLLFRG